MSFSLTTKQFEDRTKDVTRRIGWAFLKPGDVVMGVEKAMGLKAGEKIKKLHAFRVVSNTRQRLDALVKYAQPHYELKREGFPHLSCDQFIRMFCDHNGCKPTTEINRIEFTHL